MSPSTLLLLAVLSQAPATPGPVPATAAPEEPERWTGSVGIGLISLTGNANTLTFTGSALVERRTTHWIFNLRAAGSYGQTRATEEQPPQIVAQSAQLQLRGDRRITPVVSAFLLLGSEGDHLKSIELRTFGEAGTGFIVLDRKEEERERAFLRTDLALRFSDERRFQYFPTRQDVPDVRLVAPRLGLAFRYALSENVRLSQDAEVLPSILGSSRVLANTSSKLTVRLTEVLALNVTYLMQHDSEPAAGKVPTDTALTVGVEVGL